MKKAAIAAGVALLSNLAPASLRADPIVAGLDNPTPQQWQSWYSSLLQQRLQALSQLDLSIYSDPAGAWSDTAYRQYMIFMYDPEFFRDGQYRTTELIQRLTARFGRIGSVLLWHAYPQLGFDGRNQFDFYEQMPGGLRALRTQVTDVFHAAGIRVFLDYNPWDEVTDEQAAYAKLAQTVAAVGADGVMLDTMDSVPPALRDAVLAARPGAVFSPEEAREDAQLALTRQSWAQWFDLGDDSTPSIYRFKWLVPQHQQLAIRRWDRDRTLDIVYSFFNASGLLLWENVFGTWNPYSLANRQLIAETASVLDSYQDILTRGEWLPLIPTGVTGLDANQWNLREGARTRSLMIFRNRTDQTLYFDVPAAPAGSGLAYFDYWKLPAPQGKIAIPPRGTQALALDEPAQALAALARFQAASRAAAAPVPVAQGQAPFEAATPDPWQIHLAPPAPAQALAPGYARIPGGSFTMTITHAKREEGCYPWGGATTAAFGYPYTEVITHRMPETVGSFAMKLTAVTNAEYLDFVLRSGYAPADPSNFLNQIPRAADGSLPRSLDPELARLPVTYVSLNDARAYARWAGARLPTEAEWQWAAEGAGDGRAWPWGNDAARAADPTVVNLTGRLAAADAYPAGASKQGVLNLTGNAWELTESEWTDGHTRYVMLRGGVYLPPGGSEWMIPRGPRPNGFHAKYLEMSDRLERSATISFRTVQDLR